MAASTEQKLDYLLKKIGYTASKTGLAEDSSLSGTKKAPFAEAIPSPLVTPSTTIWNESASIPTTPPGSDTAQVRVYLKATSGHRMTVDSTVSGSRAFIAYSTYNNTSTAILGDWIDPQFGDAYIIQVFRNDPSSGTEGVDYFKLSAAGAGSNDTWFFDYSSGVLNFNGTVIPSGVTDNNIYVVGYRYIGVKGIATAGITTSGTSIFKDLNVTGVSTFAGNINANGNIIGDNSTNITGIAGVTATTLTGTLQTAAQTNITSVGTLGALTVSGNVNANGNIVGDNSTNISGISSVTATSLFGALTGTLQTAAQPNITSVGTLTSLNVTGDVSIGGTLTYEDVTNIDSVGLITARTGIKVLAGGINAVGVVTATSFDGSLATTNLTGTITNAQLAGSIANDKLANSTVSYGGVSLALGSSDATPAFNLTDATNYPFTSLTGITTVIFGDTTPKLGGDLNGNSKNIHSVGILTATTFSGNLTGTVNTAAQPNITSLGTLSSLTVSGNINANGNIIGDGATNISGISSLTLASEICHTGNTDTSLAFGTDVISLVTGGVTRLSVSALDSKTQVVGNFEVTGISTLQQLNVTGVSTFVGIVTFQNVDINNGSIDGTHIGFNHRANGQFINLDAQGTLGVDGTSTLNNLNVSGVSTFAGNINANGNIIGDGATNISGIASITVANRIAHTGDDHTSLAFGPDTISHVVGGVTRFSVNGNTQVADFTVNTVNLYGNLNNTGVSTFAGNINANGNIIGDNSTNITGINSVTAVKFFGDGEGLTNVGVDTVTVNTNSVDTGTLNVSGISTFSGITGFSNQLNANGDVNIGNATSDTLSVTSRIDTSLVPTASGTRNLGQGDRRWHLYGENITVTGVSTFADTINLGDGDRINFLDTNTSIRAETEGLLIDSAGSKNIQIHVNAAGGSAGDFIVKSSGNELFKIDAGDVESTFTSTDTGSSAGPVINLYRNSASPADADYLGQIKFQGESDTGVQRNYAKITGKILDASNGTEDGILEFAFLKAGSNNISGRFRSDSLQLLNGTNFSVAGDSTFTGDINANGNIVGDNSTNITGIAGVTASTLTGTLQTAAQTNITSVGTLTSLNVTGDVSIGGTLTYEDVTNIDSIGIVTARTGIKVLAGGINAVGVVTGTNGLSGTILTAAQTNITSVGTLSALTVSGNINANGNIVGDNATNISGINSVTASAFYGDGSNLSNVGFTTSVGTFNASSGVATIDSFAHATEDYKVAEYTLHFTNGSNIQAQKLLVMQDGTTAYSQEFAVMSSGSQLVSVDSAISGANVLVRATPESGISGTTTFRWRRIVQE